MFSIQLPDNGKQKKIYTLVSQKLEYETLSNWS